MQTPALSIASKFKSALTRGDRPADGNANSDDTRGDHRSAKARPQRRAEVLTIPLIRRRARDHRADTRSTLGQALINALEQSDPTERLLQLRRLYQSHGDHPAVLYHVAIAAALAGDGQLAREAGERLGRIEPERYRQLCEMAGAYWPLSTIDLAGSGRQRSYRLVLPGMPGNTAGRGWALLRRWRPRGRTLRLAVIVVLGITTGLLAGMLLAFAS